MKHFPRAGLMRTVPLLCAYPLSCRAKCNLMRTDCGGYLRRVDITQHSHPFDDILCFPIFSRAKEHACLFLKGLVIDVILGCDKEHAPLFVILLQQSII